MEAAPDASDTAAVEEAEAHDVRRLRWILRVSRGFVSPVCIIRLSVSLYICLSLLSRSISPWRYASVSCFCLLPLSLDIVVKMSGVHGFVERIFHAINNFELLY